MAALLKKCQLQKYVHITYLVPLTTMSRNGLPVICMTLDVVSVSPSVFPDASLTTTMTDICFFSFFISPQSNFCPMLDTFSLFQSIPLPAPAQSLDHA
jgi:hypothetical protein